VKNRGDAKAYGRNPSTFTPSRPRLYLPFDQWPRTTYNYRFKSEAQGVRLRSEWHREMIRRMARTAPTMPGRIEGSPHSRRWGTKSFDTRVNAS